MARFYMTSRIWEQMTHQHTGHSLLDKMCSLNIARNLGQGSWSQQSQQAGLHYLKRTLKSREEESTDEGVHVSVFWADAISRFNVRIRVGAGAMHTSPGQCAAWLIIISVPRVQSVSVTPLLVEGTFQFPCYPFGVILGGCDLSVRLCCSQASDDCQV